MDPESNLAKCQVEPNCLTLLFNEHFFICFLKISIRLNYELEEVHYGVLTIHSTLHSMDYIFECAAGISAKFLPELGLANI